MKLSIEQKKIVLTALKQDLEANYTSQAKQAVSLSISSAQLSRIYKGELEQVISEPTWLSIARRLNIDFSSKLQWKVAETPTFVYITEQLKHCQENSVSGIFCDHADIGKTFAAREYCKNNKNAIYIDCSQVKSKIKLIKKIAQEYGVPNNGKFCDLYDDLVYYLNQIQKPLIVVDEAGDLEYSAFLELKALWNATEGNCGFYMMGADGLKVKISKNHAKHKVGYAEIFSRFGSRYQTTTPPGKEALEDFRKTQLAIITKVNLPNEDIRQVYAKTDGSLRKVFAYAKKVNN